MYCGHRRLCVCLSVCMCVSVRGRTSILLHGPGCNLDEWQGLPPSCALLGGFAIGARVSLLSPQNPNFGGVNRHFQAKLVKSKNACDRNYYIDSSQIVDSDKDHHALCRLSKHVHYKCKMAESRHIEKMGKSAYLRESLTDRQEI